MNSEEFVARVEGLRSVLYRICCMQLYEPADREAHFAVQEPLVARYFPRPSAGK